MYTGFLAANASKSSDFAVIILPLVSLFAFSFSLHLMNIMQKGDTLSQNEFIGIRKQATKFSPESWNEAHKAARPFFSAGYIIGHASITLITSAFIVSSILQARIVSESGIMYS